VIFEPEHADVNILDLRRIKIGILNANEYGLFGNHI
jgi:hypothetical protein